MTPDDLRDRIARTLDAVLGEQEAAPPMTDAEIVEFHMTAPVAEWIARRLMGEQP